MPQLEERQKTAHEYTHDRWEMAVRDNMSHGRRGGDSFLESALGQTLILVAILTIFWWMWLGVIIGLLWANYFAVRTWLDLVDSQESYWVKVSRTLVMILLCSPIIWLDYALWISLKASMPEFMSMLQKIAFLSRYSVNL